MIRSGAKPRAGARLVYILTVALAAAWVVPILLTLATSLRPPSESVANGSLWFAHHWTLQNYVSAWKIAPFATYYVNTIIIVLSILALQLVTMSLAGYAFARQTFPCRDLFFVLFLLQIMVPAEALILSNYETIKWLGLTDTRTAIILPYAATAFGTFLLRQTFRQVPKELEEASIIDGCRPLQTLWHVFVPVARPTLVAFGLTSVAYHWNEFFWPLIVTNTDKARPLTVGLALLTQAGETGAQWDKITAGTLIVVLPLLLAFLIFQRQFINSFIRSGIK